jgi:microcystin-dependent protein
MSTPFLSEIRIMSFGFPPKGWAQCNGQLLPINQNQALFALLGTNFGGDGRTTFGLPNLQGRNPMHMGNGHVIGEQAGEAAHTLTMSEMPQHTHTPFAANVAATSGSPSGGRTLSQSNGANLYAAASNLVAMAPNALGNAGGSQPHPNMQPYLVLNFCIALQGIFPTQN